MTRSICSQLVCGGFVVGRGLCRAHYTRLRRYGDPNGGGTAKGAPKKWLDNVAFEYEGDDCIEFPFAKSSGYGAVNFEGFSGAASRYICEKQHGPAPFEGAEAAHSCGNRPCCNKHHIRWATGVENASDKIIHGTRLEGEAVPSMIHRDADCMEMIRRHAEGEAMSSIAHSFGIHVRTVSRIVRGLSRAYLKVAPT